MILQALNDLYGRLRADPTISIATPGLAPQKISFYLLLRAGGTARLMDMRELKGKKPAVRTMMVPEGRKRTSGVVPYFLWDNTKYLFGADNEGVSEKTIARFHASRDLHLALLSQIDDPGAQEICAFYRRWTPEDASTLDLWTELAGSNGVFALADSPGEPIYARPALAPALQEFAARHSDLPPGQCLVTGQTAPIPNIHPAIKGVPGAKKGGAALVSFNRDAFTSLGKRQNMNAPIGAPAAFAYTTALNWLLDNVHRRRLTLGDATVVFWASRATPVENMFAAYFDEPDFDALAAGDAPEVAHTLRDVLARMRSGRPVAPEMFGDLSDVTFHILALASNASRLSVRLWETDNLGALLLHHARHLADLEIVPRSANDVPYPGIRRMLRNLAVEDKAEHVRKSFEPGLLRAVLRGTLYPRPLLGLTLNRIRADRRVDHTRAALLKAWLNRAHRLGMITLAQEVSVSLDLENRDPAYCLGRLFSVYEQVQREAVGDANATIRDRFFAAAASAPATTFARIQKLSSAHMAKIRRNNHKKFVYYDGIISEIISNFNTSLPNHFGDIDQSRFYIGYYHQRAEHFRPKKNAPLNDSAEI